MGWAGTVRLELTTIGLEVPSLYRLSYVPEID